MIRTSLVFLVALGIAVAAVGDPAFGAVSFVDVTDAALPGIADAPGETGGPAAFTGGAALGDCDGDGLADLYFTGATHDVLYRNRGDGTFEDATVAANLGKEEASTRGAAFGDVDNDGDLDLYATGWTNARHFLYVNDGTCRFTEQAAARGAAVGSKAIGRSPSFGDYDRDGFLDLIVTELQSNAINPGIPGPVTHLLHNRGKVKPGYFEDMTVATGAILDGVPGPQVGTFPFTARFSDLDRDGFTDLVVAADFLESRLFWNDGANRFVDATAAGGVGTEEHGRGAVTADFDGDGLLDLFVTSIFAAGRVNATGNRLYRNVGNRTFADVTDAAGVRDAGWGWGAQALDVDNDGDLDLVVTNGVNDDEGTNLYIQADLAGLDLAPFVTDPVRLWENGGGGTFTDVAGASGLIDQGAGQGVLAVDVDADGDLDVVLTHDPTAPRLLRNDGGNANHWLDVQLDGARAPRNGIGAVVTVTPVGGSPMVQEVSASSTYLAQDGTGRLHFGLGARRRVKSVRIEWPSGRVQTVKRPRTDRLLRVAEDLSCRGRIARTDPNCQREIAERKCILALNGGGARVALRAAQRFVGCVSAAGRGEGSGDACLSTDPDGRIADERERTEALGAERCEDPPSFGPTSALAVCDASEGIVRPQDVFGPTLDGVLVARSANPKAAACQLAAAKGVAKVALARLKAFNRCKAKGLARAAIKSTTALRACWETAESAVTAAGARTAKRTAAACADLDLGAVLPGKCRGAASDGVGACLTDASACGACLTLNGADGIGQGCHRFAAGLATTYCGDRPSTTESIAHQWDEVLLDAIRADTPRPTTHGRNLFHLSALMWDVWRAYGGGGTAWLTDETHASDDPARDREIAISFAAYRLLAWRFQGGPGEVGTQAELRQKMYDLGFDVAYTTTEGNEPAAVGNRMAAAMIAFGLTDGANEGGNYADPSYVPVNAPLVVKQPGTVMADPNRWQPLALDVIVTQNGIPLPGNIQTAIGTRWNQVVAFALERDDPNALYLDPGPPPLLGGVGDAEFKAAAVKMVEYSSQLGVGDGVTIDISPGARGNNPLGTNDGTGYPTNPVTGLPYAANVVPRADFLRVLAEFWADGPRSETPPGHWNVLANEASDEMTEHRIGGTGADLDRLEWDVKLYLALNGAVHDAGIVAWGVKKVYDSVRPISMVRYLGGHGQSSDPMGPSYSPEGLPLVPDLVEVITPATTAAGQRHAALAGHEGEIAIRAYGGPPSQSSSPPAGVRWIRAVEWKPYQKPTFVTPAFPGYISGHSTFSRSAAEVMTAFTGDAFVPGGLGEFYAKANEYLTFETGPSVDVHLQWATWYDAADLAGLSRVPGGIHVTPDDFHGRMSGAEVGMAAYAKALTYFGAP